MSSEYESKLFSPTQTSRNLSDARKVSHQAFSARGMIASVDNEICTTKVARANGPESTKWRTPRCGSQMDGLLRTNKISRRRRSLVLHFVGRMRREQQLLIFLKRRTGKSLRFDGEAGGSQHPWKERKILQRRTIAPFQTIRSDGQRMVRVIGTTSEKDGSSIDSQEYHFERSAEYTLKNSSERQINLGKDLMNPNRTSTPVRIDNGRLANGWAKSSLTSSPSLNNPGRKTLGPGAWWRSYMPEFRGNSRLIVQQVATRVVARSTIRSDGQRMVRVIGTTSEKDGSSIDSQEYHFERSAEYTLKNSSERQINLGKDLMNPNRTSTPVRIDNGRLANGWAKSSLTSSPSLNNPGRKTLGPGAWWRSYMPEFRGNSRLIVQQVATRVVARSVRPRSQEGFLHWTRLRRWSDNPSSKITLRSSEGRFLIIEPAAVAADVQRPLSALGFGPHAKVSALRVSVSEEGGFRIGSKGHSDYCVLIFDFICYWARNPEPKGGFETPAVQTFRECASFLTKLNRDQPQWKTYIGLSSRKFTRLTRCSSQKNHHAVGRAISYPKGSGVFWKRRCTKDVTLTERVQRAATKMVTGLKSMDYETRLAVLDVFPSEYRHLRVDLIPTYALFEQGLANRLFTVDPANTRRGHGERQPLHDKNKTDPGNLVKSLDPVYQPVNP
ncbi:hypothetical protein CLF_102304 [Clonorchis sinensis]|uniref:Pol-related protein n=1 Tax=Clonorchis sinensis TaxID=79923 RepID=G7YN03_CLOSI|nr:hypothetical protein CLF_102304 [Clonorchis sinensis]